MPRAEGGQYPPCFPVPAAGARRNVLLSPSPPQAPGERCAFPSCPPQEPKQNLTFSRSSHARAQSCPTCPSDGQAKTATLRASRCRRRPSKLRKFKRLWGPNTPTYKCGRCSPVWHHAHDGMDPQTIMGRRISGTAPRSKTGNLRPSSVAEGSAAPCRWEGPGRGSMQADRLGGRSVQSARCSGAGRRGSTQAGRGEVRAVRSVLRGGGKPAGQWAPAARRAPPARCTTTASRARRGSGAPRRPADRTSLGGPSPGRRAERAGFEGRGPVQPPPGPDLDHALDATRFSKW